MTVTRLRKRLTQEQLDVAYNEPHDHAKWGRGHGERVAEMIRIGNTRSYSSAADLSCGNAHVIKNLRVTGKRFMGDYAQGYAITGPIEKTLLELEPVELFVSGETLEHLDRPTPVLRKIRKLARYLLLSTPIDNFEDTNAEHYWAWSRTDIEDMLRNSGFITIHEYAEVDSTAYGEPYKYGIWLAG